VVGCGFGADGSNFLSTAEKQHISNGSVLIGSPLEV
jgi:hypothetical protein